jgi:hypothetical protein
MLKSYLLTQERGLKMNKIDRIEFVKLVKETEETSSFYYDCWKTAEDNRKPDTALMYKSKYEANEKCKHNLLSYLQYINVSYTALLNEFKHQ